MTSQVAEMQRFVTTWALDELAPTFRSRCDEADCVVGLARAAPRLLEVQRLLEIGGCPVFSERAMDYLPRNYFEGKVVLLFDDTINYGSTMDVVRKRLEALGATVHCLAAAVDSEVFLGRSSSSGQPSKFKDSLRAEWLREFSHQQIGAFHNAEVSQFRRLGKPYTIDYPVYSVPLASSASDYSPGKIAELIGETNDRPFFWPSTTRQLGRDLHAISVPVSVSVLDQVAPNVKSFVTWQPYSKLRLYLDLDEHVLRVASMAQFDTYQDLDSLSVADPCAEAIWCQLKKAIAHGPSLGEQERFLAYHRALVFSVSVGLGRLAWYSLLRPVLASLLEPVAPKLSSVEPRLVFGDSLATEITEAFSKYISVPPVDSPDVSEFWHTPVNDENAAHEPSDKDLWDRVTSNIDSLGAYEDCGLRKDRDAFENIGALLPVLRKTIDDDRRDAPDEDRRLQRGLTFGDLRLLMQRAGIECSTLDISFAIDLLVDDGMLVPLLVYHKEAKTVVRAYRSGENDRAERTRQLRAVVHTLLVQWSESGKRPLSEKGFSKLFAILLRLFPDLPYIVRLRTYGVEPYVDETEFRVWCEQHGIIDLVSLDGTKGSQ